jgi:dTDP-4-dehydrorhamnose reductase
MRILVLGGTGMLGHKVFQHLSLLHSGTWITLQGSLDLPCIARTRLFQSGRVIEHFDAADLRMVRRVLDEHRPDVVVNCIGIIKQRSDAHAAIPSILLNALLPHILAEECHRWGGRVIHFSTDCVFSGRYGNYREEDLSDAEDLYGKTKYLGEVATPNAVTLRTSFIGRELFHCRSLLEWFLSQNGKTVRGYTRAFYSGVTTNHMSEVVASLIDRPDLSGLYHLTSGTISKFDLLRMIRDRFKLDIDIVPYDDFFCDRSMLGDKFREVSGYRCPLWPELIDQLAADPTPYELWRVDEAVSR